jgi:hypothetical protein
MARKFEALRDKMPKESRERARLKAERILFDEEEFRLLAERYCERLNAPPSNEATHATSDALFALLARYESLLQARREGGADNTPGGKP